MREWYPQFALITTDSRRPYWSGRLKPFRTRLTAFHVCIEYRERLVGVPQVWVVDPEISRRTHPFHPHLNTDGSLCSFFVPDLTYDQRCHDVSRLVDLTGDWLRKHCHYEEFGFWPGPIAPHDPASVLKELAGQGHRLCVCGSGKVFELCCKSRYEELDKAMHRGRVFPLVDADQGQMGNVERLARVVREFLGPSRTASLLPKAGPSIRLRQTRHETGS